jgi:hypothetical protein
MSWTNWPPVNNTTDITAWSWLDQLWAAAAEKRFCLGNTTHWPPANTAWGSGTITSISNVSGNSWTLTDTGQGDLPDGESDTGTFWGGVRRGSIACGDGSYWVGVDCSNGPGGGQPYFNGSYDVIIEHSGSGDEWYRDNKPWKVIRGTITANTNKTLTFTAPIADHVTAGYLSSSSALVGARFYIVRSGKLWWADKDFAKGRYPSYPNDDASWIGSGSGKVYSDGKGYLREQFRAIRNDPYNYASEANAWPAGQWNGKQVLVYGSDGLLKRLTITGNDKDTIFFGSLDHIPTSDEEAGTGDFVGETPLTTSYTVGGDFAVVISGRKGFPGRQAFAPFWWYGGAQESVYSHDPSNDLLGRNLAWASDHLTWNELESLEGVSCGDPAARRDEYNVLDNDVVSSTTNMCTPAEQFFAPHLYKTPRGIQMVIEGLIGSFVQPDVDWTSKKSIHNYSAAQAFHDCAINSGTTTTSKTSSSVTVGDVTTTTTVYSFTVSSTYIGVPVYWDVISDTIRRAQSDGTNASDSGGKIVVFTGETTTSEQLAAQDAIWLGASVVYSAGWTRYHPHEFQDMYESTAFIPDIDPGEGLSPVPSAIHPPLITDFCCDDEDPPPSECCKSCDGKGQWIHREPSSGFKVYDAYGYAVNNGGGAFTASVVARYAGRNWHDPGTDQVTQTSDDATDLMYWDRLGDFRHPLGKQAELNAQRSGYVETSTKSSITDTSKSWWANWYTDHNGTGITHTGTVHSGGTTSITIEQKWADSDDEDHCWFNADRFVGDFFSGGPFTHFVLEVDQLVDDGGSESEDVLVTRKYVITSVTNTTLDVGGRPVIHFAAQDGVTIAAGETWRIKEPATNLNRFRGRRVLITPPADSEIEPVELDITHNDDDTLFFAEQDEAFPEGSTFQIVEHTPGGVWQFATTQPTDGRAWVKIGTGKYWIQPVGSDARGQPWHTNQTENLPHKSAKKYGKIHKGDYITRETFTQMHDMLNRLRETMRLPNFVSRADGVTPEDNTWMPIASLEIGCQGDWSLTYIPDSDSAWCFGTPEDNDTTWATALACYNNATTFETLNTNPYMTVGANWGLFGWTIFGSNAYAYGELTGHPNLIASSKDFYAMGWIDSTNSEERSGPDFCENWQVPECCETGCPSWYDPCPDSSFEPTPGLCWRQSAAPWIQDYRLYIYDSWSTYKFDAGGTGLTWRTFQKYHDEAPSKDARIVTDQLGSASAISPVDQPRDRTECVVGSTGGPTNIGTYTIHTDNARFGYYVGQHVCVLNWAVEGGLRYVP